MTFVTYYTRVIVQFVLFILTKVFLLRGRGASPHIAFDRGSHLVAANHRAGLDPFVILASVRFRDFFKLAPFSFMTANVFMQPLLLRPLAWATGCFPAYPGLGPYGIDKAIDDLNHGYTVMIFPEGKRANGTRVEAKRGVRAILDGAPKAHLILAHIEWSSSVSVRSIRIAHLKGKAIPSTPNAVMDAIYKL